MWRGGGAVGGGWGWGHEGKQGLAIGEGQKELNFQMGEACRDVAAGMESFGSGGRGQPQLIWGGAGRVVRVGDGHRAL